MDFLRQNKILIAISFLIIAFFTYKYFSPKDSDSLESDPAKDEVFLTKDSRNMGEYLSRLKQVQIDDKLFSSSIWASLEDFSILVPEVSPGNQYLFNSNSTVQTTTLGNPTSKSFDAQVSTKSTSTSSLSKPKTR